MFFSDSIPKNLKMKDFNAAVTGRVHLKSFPSSKAVKLNYHTKSTRKNCKNDEELKELPNNIMKIAHTCQEYNIGKIFISSIVTCTSAFANIAKTNKDIKTCAFQTSLNL